MITVVLGQIDNRYLETFAVLYRFKIELSDVDRGVYETLDFRIAQHPSETLPYLLTRVFAYALSYRDGLEFSSGGLSDPDSPALRALGHQGAIELWIEIGNPSPRKLHKATKAARQVAIYTYKNADALVADIRSANVHKASEILIYAFDSEFLQGLEGELEKTNSWAVLVQNDSLDIEIGENLISTEVRCLKIA